ncbi:DUF6153 family protein [Nocardia concava]|uniref:DUF6153 family protein n=1 Tax=Nocardia concava TaxID=257281 RepID=UPI0002F720B3|nr:DUF6153 family protein [Nocardia concava]
MVEQQLRGTRFIRAFGLLALMAGIVAMHALVVGMSHEGSGHAATSSHSGMVLAGIQMDPGQKHAGMTDRPDHDMSVPGCGDDCGNGHAGMHGCLFVLTGLLLALGLAVLAWVGLGRHDATPAKLRRPRQHRARPPPWTVLSLAELAILRI